MNEVFADLLDVCVVIYLDDILIYSDNIEDHKRHVRKVLHCLQTHGLYASPSKYVFHKKKVEFLGYLIGPEWIERRCASLRSGLYSAESRTSKHSLALQTSTGDLSITTQNWQYYSLD